MEKSLGATSISDLIGMFEGWEKVQELSEHLSGVKAQLIDRNGTFIAGREYLPLFCRLIQSSKLGETRCGQCYAGQVTDNGAGGRKNATFKCHAGLENVIFPLSIDDMPAGAIVCGRALNSKTRPEDRVFQNLAKELDIDTGQMELAVSALAAMDSSELSAFTKVLQPFVDSLGFTLFRYFNLIEKSEELIVAAKKSEGMLSIDRLTGLFNRDYFDTRLSSEISRAKRYSHPITLILIELDDFDAKTDPIGLSGKDIVLKEAASEIAASGRQAEIIVRYDDTRFAIIVPECDHEMAFRLAERVRKNIAVKTFSKELGLDTTLTTSIGIVAMYQDAEVEKLIEKAEQVLAQAKSDGGNKIRIAPLKGVLPKEGKGPYIYVPQVPKKRRVVITGLGPVTPIGIGKDAFWKGIKNGKRGCSEITLFDPEEGQCKIAAEVQDFDPYDHLPAKNMRRMDRFTQFAVAACRLAAEDAGLNNVDLSRLGVRLGTNIGGIGFAQDQYDLFLEKGPKAMSPFLATAFSIGSSSSQVSLALGGTASSLTIAGECTSGASAIADAYDEIASSRADIMLAGGAEAPIRGPFLNALDVIRLLSSRNDDPESAIRPFDLERDGIVVGEGSAMVVLEEREHALKRDAHIYCELVGYGMTCDSYHMVQPDPEGKEASRAINIALENAGLKPTDIDYVNAHGSSTPVNDVTETLIIKNVFGDHAKSLPVSGTKSMTGHSIGAVSAMEVAAVAKSIDEQYIPPTVNYEYPDPDCDLDYVPNVGRNINLEYAVSNAFGFGGKNSILVFAKHQ